MTTTIQPGLRLEAVIQRIEPYALYLKCMGETVIVLIPDVSATPVDLEADYRTGQSVVVEIIGCIESQMMYKGTMRGISQW